MKKPVNENQKAEELRILQEVLRTEPYKRPPTIGLIGVSGVGKSSTINTLFKTSLAVSDTVACTKEFEDIDLQLAFVKGELQDKPVQLRVVDAPGLGEDIAHDPKYIEMYHTHLPKCDVILWVLTARNRAVALDQQYLREFVDLHDRMVFGLHQVDLVEPLNWDTMINLPSDDQLRNIGVIVQDRRKKLEDIVQKEIKLIPYSSKMGYNLQVLFTSLLESCPGERAWIFDDLKNFDYRDFIPAGLLQDIADQEARPAKKTGITSLFRP